MGKISSYSADTTPTLDDLIITVDDPSGTPANKKVTLGNLFRNLPVGSVGAPGLTFIGDQNTGFYWIGADNIGLAIAGALEYDFSATVLNLKGNTLSGDSASGGTLTLQSTSHSTKGTISVGRLTLSDLANADGIVFGSLGTATKGIDLSGSGLSGADILIYFGSNEYWSIDNGIRVSALVQSPYFLMGTGYFYSSANDAMRINPGEGTNSALLVGSASKTLIGSLTACTSNGTATITKTTHGLTLAVGELVHVTGSSTSADKGFYRIVSSGASTIVVDRSLTGTQTDVALTVYKDVISMHATDATNGQMLTSWSAQNKPMQLGGTVLAATGHSLTSEDILIGGDLEVDGVIYADAGIDVASGQVYKLNNIQVVGARVVDERADDVIEAAHDALYPLAGGLLDALRDAMIAHGLIAAA